MTEKKTTKKSKEAKELSSQNESVLEKYLRKGWLDMPNSDFCAQDRKRVGEWLARDFYLGDYNDVKSIDLSRENIASTNHLGRDEALFYRNRYLEAAKSIPAEFWPDVRLVCIENKELKGDETVPPQSLINKHCVYLHKSLLNMGLNRLIKHYLQKNKKEI